MVKRHFPNPSAIVALGFMVMIAISTIVLMLPISRVDSNAPPDFLKALFTATSAVCVTGLTVVDTHTYWSGFGQAALLVMFKIGGFGMMVTATLLGLWAARSQQLRARLLLQSETRALSMGDVRGVFRVVWITSLIIETMAALCLTLRFMIGYGKSWKEALWQGLFHAISAFNNAGFSTFSNNLVNFSADIWILGPIMLSVIIGGLGFPVLYELWQRLRSCKKTLPRMSMSIHVKITLIGTGLLLAFGTLGMAAFEWTNPQTLAPMQWPHKMLSALFASVVARTAGFNTLDLNALRTESYVLHYLLMFIGAGSSSTAGGIKVTTIGVLLAAVWSELRGKPDVEFSKRRIDPPIFRQALTLLVLSSGMIVFASLAITPMTTLPYEQVLFEIISAFGTVGVSTGITAQLPPSAQLILIAIMFTGRVGVMTMGVALAAQPHRTGYRYPEEKPIVG